MTGSYVSQLDPQVVHSIVRKPFDVDMMAEILTSVASAMKSLRTQRTDSSTRSHAPNPSADANRDV